MAVLRFDRADAVFAGGGVKAIALVGAFCQAAERGIAWQRLAGTSAGAIVAALGAAGYQPDELYRLFVEQDEFGRARGRRWSRLLPVVELWRLLTRRGLYDGVAVEEWLDGLLAAKGARTFDELRARTGRSLKVVCTDLTQARRAVFPDDAARYGLDGHAMPIARALRISCSMPIYFQPVELDCCTLVDGGLLYNFPITIFDVPGGQPPRWPTLGFRLVDPPDPARERAEGLLGYLKSIFTTMHDAHAPQPDADRVRTILVPTLGVRTMDLDLSAERRAALFQAGRDAARLFFEAWDYARYLREVRGVTTEPPPDA